MQIDKKVTMSLVGLDANAFYLLGAFSREAKRQGWTKEEIDFVLNKAKEKDYNHLVATLMDYTTPITNQEDDEEDEEDDPLVDDPHVDGDELDSLD